LLEGHQRDSEVSRWIQAQFLRIGITDLEIENHTLILSFPNTTSEMPFRSKVKNTMF